MSSQSFELKSRLVQAGAGAGKTTSLSKHVFDSMVGFQKANKRFPKFVVCTFTVKATQELRERLIKYAHDSKDQKLIEIIKDPAHITISTIHGLLNGILRKYAMELGLQPDFQLQDELTEARYRKQLTRKLLLKTPELQSVLEDFTFQEVNEILYQLFLAKLNSPSIAAIDAKELNKLFEITKTKILQQADVILPLMQGIEGFADFVTYLQEIKLDFSKLTNIENVSLPRASKKIVLSDDDWAAIKSLYKYLKDNTEKACLDNVFWQENIHVLKNIEALFTLYFDVLIERKVKTTKICLSEIEGIANYLFAKYPEVCDKIKTQTDYWYIDEFQDTSPVQLHVLEKLIQDTPFYVVGDPQQSIYLFRGADVSLFEQMRKTFENKHKEIQVKDINYRSHASMLGVINDIFTPYGFLEMKANSTAGVECAAEIILHEEGTSYEQIFGLIENLKQQGHSLSDIAILTKTNIELSEIQKFLLDRNIPVLVSASGGLFDNRMVKDLLYFLLLLANPHNNEVLLTVLRNPVWNLSEKDIVSIFCHSKEFSVWSKISELLIEVPALQQIYKFFDQLKSNSFSQVLQNFIIDYDILHKSFLLDASGLTYANVLKFQQLLKEQEKVSSFQIIRFAKYCLGYYSPFEESEAVSPVMDDHLQLMTVHKSKGLQFKFVLLPFMHKGYRDPRSRSLLIDTKHNKWTLALPHGEENKKQHNIFGVEGKEKQDQNSLEEYLRLFYVAVTRSIQKVYFVGEQKKDYKGSWFSYLPSVYLTSTETQTDRYICKHTKYPTEGKMQDQKSANLSLKKASDILQPSRRFSVTQILTSETLGNFAPDAKQLLLSEHLGTKTHSILEKWRFHKTQDESEVLQYLKSQKDFPFLPLMEVAFVEWGFSYKVDQYLMEGKVDLWGVVNNELWIVDYKTGSDRYKEKAFSQLQYYSLPIRAFTGIQKAHLVVTYPFAQKTYVREAESVDSLAAKIRQDLLNWQSRSESLIQTL